MKAAIITDLHFGSRGDSPIFLDALERFFQEDFFPYLETNNIKTVFHLGDTYHSRTQIKYSTFVRSKEMFFDRLESGGYDYHTIIGNHDTVFKNTNYPNSVVELLKPEYPKFHIYTEPYELNFDSTKILWIPWIPENSKIEADYMEIIAKSNADILFLHASINGFLMQRGRVSDHGLDHKKLSKFEIVGSGHFHHRSTKENIWYFGAPYQMDWNDYGNTKGFHIFDSKFRSLEFVPNSHDVYHVLDYDENDIPKLDSLPVDGCFVRINVLKKESQVKFDAFLTLLDNKNPYKVDIIDRKDYGEEEISGLSDVKDTKVIMKEFVTALEIDKEKKLSLNKFLEDLYNEAITL